MFYLTLRSNLLNYLQAGQNESLYSVTSYLMLSCHAWSLQFDYLSPAPTEYSVVCCSNNFSRYKDSPFCSLTSSPLVLQLSGFHYLWARHFFPVLSFCSGLFMGFLCLFGLGFLLSRICKFFSPDFVLLALLLLSYLDSITSACELVHVYSTI